MSKLRESTKQADEITKQLTRMKMEINQNLVDDLKEMRELITKDVIDAVQSYLDKELIKLHHGGSARDIKNEVMADMNKKMADMNNQIALVGDKQLVATKQMAETITSAASKQIYQAVLTEINDKIMPKVNNMVQWVNYQTQDTTELITDYRHAVAEQSYNSDRKFLAIKGEDKKSWAGGNVRVMWDDSDAVT